MWATILTIAVPILIEYLNKKGEKNLAVNIQELAKRKKWEKILEKPEIWKFLGNDAKNIVEKYVSKQETCFECEDMSWEVSPGITASIKNLKITGPNTVELLRMLIGSEMEAYLITGEEENEEV